MSAPPDLQRDGALQSTPAILGREGLSLPALALRLFLNKLIRKGALAIIPAKGQPYHVGDGSAPACAIAFADRRAEIALALDPELALGELYVAGRLRLAQGDIFDLLALVTANVGGGAPTLRLAGWRGLRSLFNRFRRGIGVLRSRANVAHHYDLDGRLFRLFLDADMQYSCAYFERPDMDLDAAQRAKKRHIAAKLAVAPGASVLDIGCGWGGLALYLAQNCDAQVLGVTLSSEQLEWARRRAAAAGLADRARFSLTDYRDISGRFDRVVSVGMLEHVGAKNLDAFFRRVAALLADDGVALIHTIAHFSPPAPTNPWVTRHIFPDGHIPALEEIAPALARAGLIVADMETLRDHYACTVAHWRQRFLARRDEAAVLYGEAFCRTWEFYLAASECAFRWQGCVVVQLQLTRRFDALPVVRDYIGEAEQALRRRDERIEGSAATAERS